MESKTTIKPVGKLLLQQFLCDHLISKHPRLLSEIDLGRLRPKYVIMIAETDNQNFLLSKM